MIVLDIETSGLDFHKCGIIQIGALELENPANQFLQEGRIDDDEGVVQSTNLPNAKTVEEVTGKTEQQMRDKTLQSQMQLLENFFEWCKGVKVRNFICQNTQFDYSFVLTKANKFGLSVPFYHRAFDLPTIAQIRYLDLKGKFSIKGSYTGMGLREILEFVGMKDERDIHSAIEDARITAECFSRLVYGKNLLEEFKEFPIPDYLRK